MIDSRIDIPLGPTSLNFWVVVFFYP